MAIVPAEIESRVMRAIRKDDALYLGLLLNLNVVAPSSRIQGRTLAAHAVIWNATRILRLFSDMHADVLHIASEHHLAFGTYVVRVDRGEVVRKDPYGWKPVGRQNAVSVAANHTGYFVVDAAGDLWEHKFGRSKVILDNVKVVKTMLNVTFALRHDGTVWGAGAVGKLGPDGRNDPNDDFTAMRPILHDVQSIATSDLGVAAVMMDGTVRGWDCRRKDIRLMLLPPQMARVPGLENVAQVSMGHEHCFAVTRDGTLLGWGNNPTVVGNGVRKMSSFNDQSDFTLMDPQPVMRNVRKVATGDNHTLALTHDDRLWAWGYGKWGGTVNPRYPEKRMDYPRPMLRGVTDIAAFGNSSFVARADGVLWEMNTPIR